MQKRNLLECGAPHHASPFNLRPAHLLEGGSRDERKKERREEASHGGPAPCAAPRRPLYAESANSLTLVAANAPALWKKMVMNMPESAEKPPFIALAKVTAGFMSPP